MRVAGPGVSARADRPDDLLRLDLVVTPRWLRERRRAGREAASPEVLVAEVARQVAALTRPGGRMRLREILREQGVEPVGDWSRFGEQVPDEVWEPFFAAIMEAKGR
jgi:hypothetical protein